MLKQIVVKINDICYQLEYISMSDVKRARLEGELSKLVDDRKQYLRTMEDYGWAKESSKSTKKT